MIRDSGFWSWPVDMAAARSKSRSLAMMALTLYGVGAAMLLVQTVMAGPTVMAEAGVAAILLGLVVSVLIVAKVLVTRSRLSFH